MSLLSGSISTWSHQLPDSRSSGLAGSQCLSFFPHEGPGLIDLDLAEPHVLHHLLVEGLGVLARPQGEAEDGVEAHAAEPAGGSHAGPLHQVLGDAEGLLLGQLGAEQRRAGPLGKALAASGAAEAADAPGLAGPAVGPEVVVPPPAVERAIGVGASQRGPVPVFHDTLLAGSDAPTA